MKGGIIWLVHKDLVSSTRSERIQTTYFTTKKKAQAYIKQLYDEYFGTSAEVNYYKDIDVLLYFPEPERDPLRMDRYSMSRATIY